MNKDQLIEEFRTLVKEHGHDWTKIASLLNNREIQTTTGAAWNRDNARDFFRRHVNPKSPVETEKPPKKESITSPGLPDWMDTEAQEDLKAMLDWWRQKKSSPLGEIQARPVFKGTRRNSGFHINDEILKRAMKKVKTDKVRTGGSMSLLVELLLWEYIDRPADVLEPFSPVAAL